MRQKPRRDMRRKERPIAIISIIIIILSRRLSIRRQMLSPKRWELCAILGVRGGGASGEYALLRVPDSDDERWRGGWCGCGCRWRNLEPESFPDGERGSFAGVDEVPSRREVFDASETGRGGECEEVDGAEDAGGEVDEEKGGG